MSTAPPKEVQEAAAIVNRWLADREGALAGVASASAPANTTAGQQGDGRITNEEYTRMTAAEKLDYARRFDQNQFTKGTANHGRR